MSLYVSVLACWVSMEQERPPHFVCSPVTPEYQAEMRTSILTGGEFDGIYSSVMITKCVFSIRTDMDSIRQTIGYCPQFDALIEPLTGRQHLILFCRLRGIPKKELEKVCGHIL